MGDDQLPPARPGADVAPDPAAVCGFGMAGLGAGEGVPGGGAFARLLDGAWHACGLVESAGGRARAGFQLLSEARAAQDGVEVHEHYRFDSGRQLHRVWLFRAAGAGLWQAQADDLSGTGMAVDGHRLAELRYRVRVPWRGLRPTLVARDRLYDLGAGESRPHRDGTGGHGLLLRSTLRKFGLPVLHLSAVYRRLADGAGTDGGAAC